jgi:cell division protein FtsB
MSTPRRSAAGRRPARPGARPGRPAASRTTASRTTASRTTARGTDASRTTPAVPPVAGRPTRSAQQPRRSPFTPRAAVLALIVLALLTSAALPLREYLNQRGDIAELEQAQAETRQRVADLRAERERLQDPAYVAAEARRRLHFVLPGETAYVVLVPEDLPSVQEPGTTGSEAPWYSQLWGSVEQADRPTPAP